MSSEAYPKLKVERVKGSSEHIAAVYCIMPTNAYIFLLFSMLLYTNANPSCRNRNVIDDVKLKVGNALY